MLILSRKPKESVIITTPSGEKITVTYLGAKGQQFRLGFDADKGVGINREEIQLRIDGGIPAPEKDVA